MKTVVSLLIASLAITQLHAQLTNTRWKTTVTINGALNVIMDFKKDTVSVYTVADSSVIETMSYSSNDTSLTVMKIDGQSDCDNSTPGKYRYKIKNETLYINLLQDGCDDRWTVLDSTKWSKWLDHAEVKVDEAVLKQYVGKYQVDAAHPITVSFENGKLYVEGPNNNLPKSPLIALSSTKFFIKVAGIDCDFVKDANGNVTTLVTHEAKDYELKKVN